MELNKVYQGDCLELMKEIDAGSVDLILCDPPYGNMKNAPSTWVQDRTKWDTVIDIDRMFNEYNRILRMNGCVVIFGQEPFTSKIITKAHGNIPFSYRMVWIKDSFGNHLLSKKAPVSYFEDIIVFFKKYDTLAQHPIREYSKKVLSYIGKTLKQINSDMGNRKAEHFFYTESTQFGLCTKEVYDKICDKYELLKSDFFIPFEKLEEIDRRFNRRFNLPVNSKSKSNVLAYKKEKISRHPTQKPVLLFEDIIKTYTNEGDLVLDNCAGSGTTGMACQNLKRNFILIEKEPEYVAIAENRLKQHPLL